MKYNQPFDQPSNPDAAYIDGNPAAGIQGSIVPAASIEFDQREIVRVIQDVSLAEPSNADLSQLSAAVRYMREQYVLDTGGINAIAVTLNPQPPTWMTPLSFFVLIGNTNNNAAVTCTIGGVAGIKNVVKRDGSSLAVGDLVAHTIALLCYDGVQARVLTPVASEIGGGTGGPFNIWIDAPTTFTVYGTGANFPDLASANEYLSKYIITAQGSVILQLPAGQHTVAAPLNFGHANGDKITVQGPAVAAPLTAADFTVTGVNNPQLAADQARALTTLRSRIPCELLFTSGAAITVNDGYTFNNLLVSSDGSGAFVSGILKTGGITTWFSNISIHGFSGSGLLARGPCAVSGNFTATGNYQSLPPPYTAWPININAGGGVEITDGGAMVYNAEVVAASNNACGVVVRTGAMRLYGMLPGSWITPGYPCTMKGNAFIGCYVSGGGNFTGQQCVFNNNGERGALVDTGSMYGQGFVFSGNVTWGLNGLGGSDIQLEQQNPHPVVAFSGNGTGSILAQFTAQVLVMAGTGIVGTCSPAANTEGNYNSWIFV